jgi:hypothetical protein
MQLANKIYQGLLAPPGWGLMRVMRGRKMPSSACLPLDMTRSLPSRHATARKDPLGDTAMDATPHSLLAVAGQWLHGRL